MLVWFALDVNNHSIYLFFKIDVDKLLAYFGVKTQWDEEQVKLKE